MTGPPTDNANAVDGPTDAAGACDVMRITALRVSRD